MDLPEKRYRKPSDGALHVRQVPAFGDLCRGWLAVNGRRWDYYGQRLGIEGLINALLADFLESPPEEQERTLARGIERVERYEAAYNREMAAKEAAGLIEPEFPYAPTEAGRQAERAARGRPVAAPEARPGVAIGKPTRPRRDPPDRKARGA